MPRVGPFLYRIEQRPLLYALGRISIPEEYGVFEPRGVRRCAAARVGPTPIRSSGKFSGSWAVASRNGLLHNGAMTAT
jgi:hypothetical protein